MSYTNVELHFSVCLKFAQLKLPEIKLYLIASQRNFIPEDLMKASKLWEEELKDSHETTPGNPLKLAISLSHKYTEANLNFANLKGRDVVTADRLRSCGAFEVHLALITRQVSGGGNESEFDYGYYRRGYGRGRSRSPEFHTMEYIGNIDISVEKWVDERGEEVENKGLEIDDEHETLDGEQLFHREPPIMTFPKCSDIAEPRNFSLLCPLICYNLLQLQMS